jgi:hypothetical protein
VILDSDLVEGSNLGPSEWAGILSAKLMTLRAKVRDFTEGRATLEELLEAANVNLEEESTEDEKQITERLLDHINELRHAISRHRETVRALEESYTFETGLLFMLNGANKDLWEILE